MSSIWPPHDSLLKSENLSNSSPSQFEATDNHFGNKELTRQYGNQGQHVEENGEELSYHQPEVGSRFIGQNRLSPPPKENGFFQTQLVAPQAVTVIESSVNEPLHFFVQSCFSPKFKLANESNPTVKDQENQPRIFVIRHSFIQFDNV